MAECLERLALVDIKKTPALQELFLLKGHPGSSGFAAGFEKTPTQFRSICEAIERWAWSMWIDSKFFISECAIDYNKLSSVDKFLTSVFDDFKSYEIDIPISMKEIPYDYLTFKIFIGIKGDGVYPGSRISSKIESNWSHPITEAWRHFQITNNLAYSIDESSIISQRAKYYSKNKDLALAQIPLNHQTISNWKSPSLILHQEYLNDSHKDYYVYRSICGDYTGWDLGGVDRFVY